MPRREVGRRRVARGLLRAMRVAGVLEIVLTALFALTLALAAFSVGLRVIDEARSRRPV